MYVGIHVHVFVIYYSSLPLPAPESQPSPSLSLTNATSIQVDWSPPLYPNGLLTNYTLTIKLLATSSDLTLSFPSSTSTALVHGLTPFTDYSVTVTSTNDRGSTISEASNITTGEIGNRYIIDITCT